MISIPHPYPEGAAEQYIQWKIWAFEAAHSFAFAIERKSENGLIGRIEIREIEQEHSQSELSFWLAPEAWG